MPAVNDERLLRVRCDARLLFVIFAVFPALVISGSLKMLKTIRVTFQKPRLSPRPIFLSAAEDFLAVVEVRKTYVDFEVVNNSDDSGLPPQLLMPIRVDNDPQTILLWLSEDVNYRQVNVDLVKAACRTRLHLSDGECQRLLTSADIFVNRALNHTSQTSSIKICLRVNREGVVGTGSSTLVSSLCAFESEDGLVHFAISLPTGTFQMLAQTESYDEGLMENYVITLRSSTYWLVVLPSSRELPCPAAVEIMAPNVHSTLFLKIDGDESLLTFHTACITFHPGSSSRKRLKHGFACMKVDGTQDIICRPCGEDPFLMPGHFYEGNGIVRLFAWWAPSLEVNEAIMACAFVHTKWTYSLLVRKDLPGSELHEDIGIITAASSAYFVQLKTLVGSIHMWEPMGTPIRIYDLGLDADQKAIIGTWKGCEIRAISDSIAPHYKHKDWLRTYAFKGVIIEDALEDFPAVLYIDAGLVLLRPMDIVRSTLYQYGYFLLPDHSNAFPWPNHSFHHPETLRRTGCVGPEKIEAATITTPCLGGIQGYRRGHWFHKHILIPLSSCSVDPDCIAPVGSNRSNHLQDQTVLNSVLCARGIHACSMGNRLLRTNGLYGARIFVRSDDIHSNSYTPFLFRRYDAGAKDFCDHGIVYKVPRIIPSTVLQV